MNSPPPQYLIRLDDFCPTMLQERREQILAILARHNVSPILAVVPDNQDPDLIRQPADPEFWDRMRWLQSAGATIALHGFRHLCTSDGPCLLKLHQQTEFAGVDVSMQQQWIRTGLAILREHGLEARLFVAPRHGFDRNTLRALLSEGLGVLSDGFSRRPFLQNGLLWIPQQLWEPVPQKTGLWTICIHTNTATADLEHRLDKFLADNGRHVTCFEKVISSGPHDCLLWSERFQARLATMRFRFSTARSRRYRRHEPS